MEHVTVARAAGLRILQFPLVLLFFFSLGTTSGLL